MGILARDFFARSTPVVARELLGCSLVRDILGTRLVGLITETEAYQGEVDLGCHAHFGRTKRTEVMYLEPGHAYVYFVYGKYWLLNFVTEPVETPAAVLIRGILPVSGMETMAVNYPKNAYKPGWLNGPAKLTQAYALDGRMNGYDLCQPGSELWVESGKMINDKAVKVSARVGLNNVPEPWKSIPWRFCLDPQENG